MPDLSVDLDRYRIAPGAAVALATRDPRDTQGLDGDDAKEAAKDQEKANIDAMQDLQERLYAESTRSVLLVLQAMDTAGKDSSIREVTDGLNPQGCRVWSFKAPSSEERAHDFLWRVHARAPKQGMIAIFNRSHYEDVLIAKVKSLAPEALIEKRYGHINDFERLLADHGTRIVKVMLHVSKGYQLERLKRRLERPDKHWKFNPADLAERERWDAYMRAYEVAMERCSTDYAPWYVVPAERRWFRDLVLTQLLRETLEDMDPQYPAPAFDPADYPPESLR